MLDERESVVCRQTFCNITLPSWKRIAFRNGEIVVCFFGPETQRHPGILRCCAVVTSDWATWPKLFLERTDVMLDDCRRPQVRSVKVRMQTAQHIGVSWWTMGVLSLWNLSVYSDSDSVNMWHGYGCVHLFTYKSPFNFPRSQPYWGVFRNCCGGKAWSTQGTRELQACQLSWSLVNVETPWRMEICL